MKKLLFLMACMAMIMSTGLDAYIFAVANSSPYELHVTLRLRGLGGTKNMIVPAARGEGLDQIKIGRIDTGIDCVNSFRIEPEMSLIAQEQGLKAADLPQPIDIVQPFDSSPLDLAKLFKGCLHITVEVFKVKDANKLRLQYVRGSGIGQ